MAGTTTTLANAQANIFPRTCHTGVQVVRQSYQYNGATLSASDMLLMMKIPRHAVILDWYLFGNGGATTTVFKVGLQGVSDTALSSAVTMSATDCIKRSGTTTAADPLPITVTTSDSNVAPWRVVQLLATTVSSATVTGSFTLAVFYALEGAA